MPGKPPSPSNFPTPLQGRLGSEEAESPDKPRFAILGPFRKSGRPRHQAREVPLPVCGDNQRASSCPSPFQESERPLQGAKKPLAGRQGAPKILAGSQGALPTAAQIGLEGEGGCLRSPPPLQTSPSPLQGVRGSCWILARLLRHQVLPGRMKHSSTQS